MTTTVEPLSDATGGDPEGGGFEAVAGHSASVAAWTGVSRVTGFLRVVTIAAVLGPTYFGNTFQSMNLLPNATYELLAGSLIASMLVPALVGHVDRHDGPATARVAGGFLGVLLVLFGGVAVVITLLGPLVSRLFMLGVDDPAALELQGRTGWLLLVLVAPQLVCYGIVGTGAAAQNAAGRFALAAGAPVVENVGVIVTMVVSAVVFGTGRDLDAVSTAQVLVLGLGATASVVAHAGLQWFGAHRAGITLRPRAGWRDPEVRRLARIAGPSLGVAGLLGARYLGILVVASSIPGGVVAFTMAVNFFHLPVALGAKPVASALLPSLSRHARLAERSRTALASFRDEWIQGLALAFVFTLPAAVSYLVLCGPLATLVAFGEMDTPRGIELIAVSLAAVSLGVVGETAFVINMPASYALHDPRTPLRAVIVRSLLALPGMVLALTVADGVWVLIVLGVALSLGDLAAGGLIGRHLAAALPAGAHRLGPSFRRSLGAAVLMAVPAGVISWSALAGERPTIAVSAQVVLGVLVGAAVYLGLQVRWRAPELRQLRSGIARREVPA